MKKLGSSLLLVLLALSIVLMGCPTEASDDVVPGSNLDNALPDTGTAGQIYNVVFKSNYLGVTPDVTDITVPVEYGASLGLTLPATGTINYGASGRPAVSSFALPLGRQFKEWNTKLDGSGIKVTATTKIKGNVTVYAIWEGKYNLSASLYPTQFELKYNPYGGKDAEGVYNYQGIVPISRFGGIPGKIAAGKNFTLSTTVVSTYDLASQLSLSLADASGTGKVKVLSNVVSTGNKPVKGIKVELLNKSLVSTAAAADFSQEASVLLVSANLPIFTEKLIVYANLSLTQGANAVDPSDTFTLDIANTATGSGSVVAYPWGPGFAMDVPDAIITKNSDGSATITLGNAWNFVFSAGGYGGFTLTDTNLSNYGSVEIEYDASAKSVPHFKLLSTPFAELASDTIGLTAELPLSSTKTKAVISLAGKTLTHVQSFAFETLSDSGDGTPESYPGAGNGVPPTTPSSVMTIYSITFKK
jgi:hypothetical protein